MKCENRKSDKPLHDTNATLSQTDKNTSRLPKPKTAKEIASTTYVGPNFVVEDLIPIGLTLLGGSPKSGKTILATAMALAAGTGQPFLSDIRVHRAKVLFISLEDSERRFHTRLSHLALEFPATDDVLFINSWNTEGQDPVELLREYLDENREIGMVIIDPWALFTGQHAAQQSGYKYDYKQVRSIKNLADSRGIAIVIIHHTVKRKSEDWVGDYYGSFAMPGAADALLCIDKARGAETAVLRATGRDVADQTIGIMRAQNGYRWVRFNGSPEENAVTPEQSEVLTLLRQTGRPMRLSELVKATGKQAPNLNNILKRLTEKGLVRKASHGLYEAVKTEYDPCEDAAVDAEFTSAEEDGKGDTDGASSSRVSSSSLIVWKYGRYRRSAHRRK
jgi:hypothetical protein